MLRCAVLVIVLDLALSIFGASGSSRRAMSGITPHSPSFRHSLSLLNGGRSTCWRLSRRSKLSHRYLATGRPSAKTIPPRSGNNSTSSRIRGYFASTLKCFGWYARQQHRRPYVTEICSMTLIYCVGDLSAQMISADGYDVHRTVRSITIGVVVAIPSHKWFLFLGRNFNYSSAMVSTSTKVVVNQLVYTTLFNVYFFAFHALLSGMDVTGAIDRVRNTVPTSLPRSFLYWPFVTAFNFTYVQPQSRSVVTAIFAVFWQSYLSWLNAHAEKNESTINLLQ